MAALTEDELELLRRARDADPMWGGSTAIERLRSDVELLLSLGLIEQIGDMPYGLTHLGVRLLEAAG